MQTNEAVTLKSSKMQLRAKPGCDKIYWSTKLIIGYQWTLRQFTRKECFSPSLRVPSEQIGQITTRFSIEIRLEFPENFRGNPNIWLMMVHVGEARMQLLLKPYKII